MGKQTLPVLVGFVAVHVATILDIVSLVEPFWLAGDYNGTTVTNQTYPSPHKGLWKFCVDDGDCYSLYDGNSTVTKRETAVTALATSGTGLVVFVVLLAYVFAFMKQCRKSQKLNSSMVFCLLVSVAAMLTSIIIFGTKGKEDAIEFETDYIVNYGYAFYVAIAGLVFTFIAMFAHVRVGRLMSQDHDGYESI